MTPLPIELENLNFSELVSVMWATNSNTNSLRIMERIDKAIEDPAFIKPINKIQQVLDKLCTQKIHLIRYSSMFDKLAQYLLKNEQFD
jgi:pantothenate kinase